MVENKLKYLPKIYYLNLDEREDRKIYMESQFDHWKICSYERYSASNYKSSNFNDWKHLVINCKDNIYKGERRHLVELATAMSTLDMIKHWLSTSNDEYCILMEDDYDLYPIEYWHFNWEYLMNNIPYDWDCIQLGFENHHTIPCFLHPILSGHSTGPCMINRHYAEKLIRLHCIEEKYNLYHNISNWWWKKGLKLPTTTVDYFVCHNGRTYSLPLITVNDELGSYEDNYIRTDRKDLTFTRKAYKKWWTELRDQYTLEDFFSFGKPNDKFIRKSDV